MALSIPVIESDNPELERFKALVATTADKYAKRHNLCGVVNDALTEMGVEKASVSKVSATTRVVVQLEVDSDFNEADFAGLTPEQERERAGELIKEQLSIAKKGVRVLSHAVIEVNPRETPAQANAGNYPGYVLRYTSDEGRVLHLFPEDTTFASRARMSNSVLCGAGDFWATLSQARETSSRGEGRVCRKCDDKFQARQRSLV